MVSVCETLDAEIKTKDGFRQDSMTLGRDKNNSLFAPSPQQGGPTHSESPQSAEVDATME